MLVVSTDPLSVISPPPLPHSLLLAQAERALAAAAAASRAADAAAQLATEAEAEMAAELDDRASAAGATANPSYRNGRDRAVQEAVARREIRGSRPSGAGSGYSHQRSSVEAGRSSKKSDAFKSGRGHGHSHSRDHSHGSRGWSETEEREVKLGAEAFAEHAKAALARGDGGGDDPIRGGDTAGGVSRPEDTPQRQGTSSGTAVGTYTSTASVTATGGSEEGDVYANSNPVRAPYVTRDAVGQRSIGADSESSVGEYLPMYPSAGPAVGIPSPLQPVLSRGVANRDGVGAVDMNTVPEETNPENLDDTTAVTPQ